MSDYFSSGQVVVVHAGPDRKRVEELPSETQLVADAVVGRRREFALGRHCAGDALATLGFARQPLMRGRRGEPLWPAGFIGSIAHSRGHAIAAVARSGGDLAGLGIDLECYEPLREDIRALVMTDGERSNLARALHDDPAIDMVVFSCKEAVYKAWYPAMGTVVSFRDCVLECDPHLQTFTATVSDGVSEATFSGRWLFPYALPRFIVATAEWWTES